MPGNSLVVIVASLHARTGKTLLARVLADYFLLSGHRPLIFDTDAVERTLRTCFPYDAIVVDLNHVRDQMTLFDTAAAPTAEARVIDVTHQYFRKFFNVMRDTEFVTEARMSGIRPVIFYIVDRHRDSFEAGRELRDRFEDCAFVVVENGLLGRGNNHTRQSDGYRALEAHHLHLTMSALDPVFVSAIEDPHLSFSDFMREPWFASQQPSSALLLDARTAVRRWLLKLFKEIGHVIKVLDRRVAVAAEPVPVAPES